MLNTQTDSQLLQAYALDRSQAAFAEIVHRYVNLVHTAAMRMLGDAQLAEDVSQAVFAALAQNMLTLKDRAVLSGWLHRTTQHIAAQTIRTKVRRRTREYQASIMNEPPSAESDPLWEQAAPQLDEAMSALRSADRDALLLRYFERKSAPEMAKQLGISDAAAQKRVNRAIERLRSIFIRRGIPVGGTALPLLLTAKAVQAAPDGLATKISLSAAVCAARVLSTSAATTKAIAMTTLQRTAVATTLLAGFTVWLWLKNRSDVSVEARPSEALKPQRAQAVAGVPVVKPGRAPGQELEALDHVTLVQLEPWLARTGRGAESLVAAWELTGDPSLEAELEEKHAGNPMVCLALLNRPDGTIKGAWVERLRKAAPDHPLPDCLDAARAAKGGDLTATKAALALALQKKGRRDDFQNARMITIREAAAAAGLDGRTAALAPTKVFSKRASIMTIASGAQSLLKRAAEGGIADKEDAAATAITLTEHLRTKEGETLMSDIILASVYDSALRYLPPETELGDTGRTLAQAVEQGKATQDLLKDQELFTGTLIEEASPGEITAYFDRWMQQGEATAMRWARDRKKSAEK